MIASSTSGFPFVSERGIVDMVPPSSCGQLRHPEESYVTVENRLLASVGEHELNFTGEDRGGATKVINFDF